MIDQIQEGSAQKIAFPSLLTLRPVANHILLNYQKPDKVGEIHMPTKVKQLDTIVAEALAVGPDVKAVKKGDRVVILAKALIGGEEGLLVGRQRVFLTQEQVVIAVVE